MTNLESKRKFYMNNRNVFLRYFFNYENPELHYQAMIDAGNFDKLERIITEGRREREKFEKDLINEALEACQE